MAQYGRMLATTTRAIDSAIIAERAHPGSATNALKQTMHALPINMRVTTPDGVSVRVDLSDLQIELNDARASFGKARLAHLQKSRDYLTSMAAAADVRSPHPKMAADAKSTLRNVLKGGEYQPSKKEELWQRILGPLLNLLGGIHPSSTVVDVLSWILLGATIILFVVVLVLLVLRLIEGLSFGGRAPRRQVQREAVTAPLASVASVIDDAEQAAAAGDYREAFRRVYLASILTLDSVRLVKFVDGVTNWEYLRTLSRQDRQDAVSVFRPMTETFDELIYGKRGVSKDDYAHSLQQFHRLGEMLQ